jgi:hypothetical protein
VAFVSNMDQEEKTDSSIAPQGAVAPVAGGSSVRLSPSSSVPSSGGGGGTAGSSPTAGGSFGSLQNYLTANQEQAQPLANLLTPGINKQYQNLDTANNATIADINKQVTNAPGYTPSNPSVLAAEAANPTSFASNPNNVQQFQSLLGNTYGGPASAESTSGYANQQNAINQAISQGQAQTNTEAGREQLLSQNEAKPTAGVTALNSAILSQDPNALSSIEGAYKPFQNLMTNLQTGAQGVNATISKEQSDAAASSQAANKAIADQQAALNTAVSGELTTAQQNAAKQNADVLAAFKNLYGGMPVNTAATTLGTYGGGSTPWVNTTNYNVNALSPQVAASLGMTPDQASALQSALQQAATSQFMGGHNFGAGSGTTQLDLSQFLQQTDPTQAITAANIATPEQYAQEQAFQTLLNSLPSNAVLNPNMATSAGTAPTSFNNFDYATALANAQQTAAAERQAAQDEANAITANADLSHAQSQHGGGLLHGITQAITHPFDTLASISNPISWIPNAINMSKGQGPTPTNMNPQSPSSQNQATQYVNNLPTQATAAALTNPTAAFGAAHGGAVEKKEEYTPFKNLVNKIPTGVK